MLRLNASFDAVGDRRQRPRIATGVVVRSVFVMLIARVGSLNALEQTKRAAFWRKWIGGQLPSADSLGRVVGLCDCEGIRELHRKVYTRLKRNKALVRPWHGLNMLIFDGHESHATRKRRCPACLERRVTTAHGTVVEYYHRHVTAMLVTGKLSVLLDAELQRPGTDEIATAVRLFERVLTRYPRAFDVILGDAAYTDPRIYQLALERGKDVLTVLKDERRKLVTDARALFDAVEPTHLKRAGVDVTCWDIDGFQTWPQVGRPVRVVRTIEVKSVRRQIDRCKETISSEHMWVTTLSRHRASTAACVDLGHNRWRIENEGFNELVNHWHGDHVYKHDPNALLNFWLLTLLAYTVFHAFYLRNLKPVRRAAASKQTVNREITAGLYHRPERRRSRDRRPP